MEAAPQAQVPRESESRGSRGERGLLQEGGGVHGILIRLSSCKIMELHAGVRAYTGNGAHASWKASCEVQYSVDTGTGHVRNPSKCASTGDYDTSCTFCGGCRGAQASPGGGNEPTCDPHIDPGSMQNSSKSSRRILAVHASSTWLSIVYCSGRKLRIRRVWRMQ